MLDDEGGRVILRDDPVTVDLLTLQNEALGLVDGVLHVPSFDSSGLKIMLPEGTTEVDGY